ncbi:MAG: efflux RND transporter permease subunit [Bacteriovoracaceae bacterium]|nr:efflux RND transporter permease subunit [Bacteriovoracaceae bacterium]
MLKTFIRKGIFTICLNLFILLLGVFNIPYLANEFIPSIEVPAVAVVVPLPLMNENKITREVAKPLERAFSKSQNLKSIETRIENGTLILILFYNWDLSPASALRKTKETVLNTKLPKEALKPIFILHRPSNNPILRFTYYGNNYQKIGEFTKAITAKLERIPGVSEVRINGLSERKTILNLDPVEMSRSNLNPSDILLNAKKNWSLRTFIKTNNIPHYISYPINNNNDLSSLSISRKRGGHIPIGSLGNINQELAIPTLYYGTDSPAITVEVLKSPGADTVSIVNQALATNVSANNKEKKWLNFRVVYNEALKIRESQLGMIKNFLIGVILNSIILMTFLGSTVGVLVASVVFPTSILGTFFVMKYLGISVNLFSLNGFSLAVGMITDASTVVLESIVRKIQNGEGVFESCWKGAKEVGMGVFASTLTTAGVLLPIAMQKNVSSKLFSDLSLTVVSTQLVCLIAVFSLVPWLCNLILKPNHSPKGIVKYLFIFSSSFVNMFIKFSASIQTKALKSKIFRIVLPSIITILSVGSVIFIPDTEFLPMVSSRVYSLYYPISRGKIHRDATKLRKKISIVLSQRKDTIWNLVKEVSDGIEAQIEFKDPIDPIFFKDYLKSQGINPNKINVMPVGPAPSGESMGYSSLYLISDRLSNEKVSELKKQICSINGVVKCLGKNHLEMTQVKIRPSHIKSVRMGVSTIESASQIFLPTHDVDLAVAGNLDFKNPFYMRVNGEVNLLQNVMEVAQGWQVRLGALFDSSYEKFSTLSQRVNGQGFTPLFLKIEGTTIGGVDINVQSIMNRLELLKSDVVGRGQLETMNETFSSMITALVFSAFIVFIILLLQFKSISQALVIMGTIPLTLGGAVFGLVLMGETVNASVMVGFILLVGIIVNNGIFLVEATNMKIGQGMIMHDAIMDSVKERTRPILMTSFSTIFGMLPVLVLGGEGSELYRGMAIVNIFGMIVGTVLSLTITPLFIEYLGRPQNQSLKGGA